MKKKSNRNDKKRKMRIVIFFFVVSIVGILLLTIYVARNNQISSGLNGNKDTSTKEKKSERINEIGDVLEINKVTHEVMIDFVMGAIVDTSPIEEYLHSDLLKKMDEIATSIEEYNEVLEEDGISNAMTDEDTKISNSESYVMSQNGDTINVLTSFSIEFDGSLASSDAKQKMAIIISFSKNDSSWEITKIPTLFLLTDVPTFASTRP